MLVKQVYLHATIKDQEFGKKSSSYESVCLNNSLSVPSLHTYSTGVVTAKGISYDCTVSANGEAYCYTKTASIW